MCKRMNIYITTSKKNLKYAYVAIFSLFVNNQDSEIFLYVVSEDLEEADMKYENTLAEKYHHHIIILRFDESDASNYIHIRKNQHWPIGTMSSYWLFHKLLPADVDRIMVIESDTVTIGSLRSIYDTNLDDCYIACPGPEHKPQNHKRFMEKLGGACVTFVLSLYNVQKIREDFLLEDILAKDEVVKNNAGNSQMEFTFGLLFKDNIKFFPGAVSCLDENERYIEELGYDYIIKCEKTAKLLHFSSYKDYSKPWNPVSIMPGYFYWWTYAQESPYYKEYFEQQWRIYDTTLEKQKKLNKNITYKNILFMCLLLFFITCALTVFILLRNWKYIFILTVELILVLLLTILFRRLCILFKSRSSE